MNFANYPELNDAELNDAIHYAVEQVRSGLNDFTTSMKYPNSVNNFYPLMDNTEWTNGFWTGEVWLAYEATKEECFKQTGLTHVESFLDRVNRNIVLEHHDLGFLYSPSCVAAYKLLNDEKAKEAALKAGDIEKASELHREQKEAEKKLEQAKKRFNKKNEKKKVPVTEEDVADVISMWTRIPVTRLNESESERLKKLDKTLEKRVIGQEEAIQALSKAVKRGRVGLKDPARPIGSFLFLGPTGVGKTELSKALAEALFGNEEDMIRVDMSEYMEKHSVSKMIGSPPGYVGHEDGGQLSEKVRRNPYSVILFDEIEKAHPDVFNILLQVLDDGHITDSQGRKVDFRNTVIIMTSNAGAKAIIEPKKLGFTQQEDQKADYKSMKANVMDEVKQLFRPEFLNRIDEIIVFHPLNEDNMKKIVGLMCKEVVQRAKEQLEITLVVRDSVKKHIVETGSDKKYGARPLRRAVQSQLEDKLAEALLNGEIKRGDHVEAGISKKEIKFTVREINS